MEPETAPLGEEVTVTVLRPDGTALRELFGAYQRDYGAADLV